MYVYRDYWKAYLCKQLTAGKSPTQSDGICFPQRHKSCGMTSAMQPGWGVLPLRAWRGTSVISATSQCLGSSLKAPTFNSFDNEVFRVCQLWVVEGFARLCAPLIEVPIQPQAKVTTAKWMHHIYLLLSFDHLQSTITLKHTTHLLCYH